MVRTPIRRCIACRRSAPKPQLVRVVAVDGTVVIDPEARRPGRGAYLCARHECLDLALRRKGAAIVRALRRPGVEVDEEQVRAGWREAGPEVSDAREPAGVAASSRSDAAGRPREEYE